MIFPEEGMRLHADTCAAERDAAAKKKSMRRFLPTILDLVAGSTAVVRIVRKGNDEQKTREAAQA